MEVAEPPNGLASSRDDSPTARISRRMVQLLKESYGRGPTRAKTYIEDEMVVVLMRGGFTRAEDTLLREGRGEAVLRHRAEFQELMRGRNTAIVSEELGREVIASMSGTHQDPDLLVEVFVLAPA